MTLLSFGQRFTIGALICVSGVFSAGCSSDPAEPEYAFGETDMQNAIVGDWSGMITLAGQNPTAITLNIARAPTLQPACGNRTFSSPLCIESSSMSVEATLSTADKVFDAVKLQGSFMVFGLALTSGELSATGTGVNMNGNLDTTANTLNLNISGDHTGSAPMQR